MVNITVIMENKSSFPQQIRLLHNPDMTLMSSLLEKNLISDGFCGGRGKCGRCRVQFLHGAPLPTNTERKAFAPDELREGYRLACMAKPKNDCTIRLDFIASPKIDVITDMIKMSEEKDHISQRKKGKETYLIAVDLGTTTIAMQLIETGSEQVIDTYCATNPQRVYGADVLSRIQAAGSGHAENLKNSVRETLLKGVSQFCHTLKQKTSQQETAQISCMCIAGNTTMEHLLMGLSTEGLGRSPFTPVEIGLQKCVLADIAESTAANELNCSGMPVYVTPGVSAFVGGDIVAGLYHCKLLNSLQSWQTADGAVLFIDLGTNGEMAITDGSRMIVTATAAGPAFEGGAGAAVPGSDMIAVTASLLEQGIVDRTGFLEKESVYIAQKGIHFTQKDIRDIQMAKAAVRAGVEILCEKMGYPSISKVFLAGGFGCYLDVDAAVAIGLLPESLRAHTLAAGNTSLAGAFTMGRDLCMGKIQEETLAETLRRIECINLAEQENFETLYLNNLNFP